jgi:hypothetical protein
MVSRWIFLASLAVVAAGVFSPFVTTIDTCDLSSPCISGTNSGVGAGIAGISLQGRGVNGITKHNSTAASNAMYGLYGQDLSTSGGYNAGVAGISTRGSGVAGFSSAGSGLAGFTSSGFAIYGKSNYTGLYALGGTFGTYATGTGANGIGSYGASNTGEGIVGFSQSGIGVQGTSPNGIGAQFTGGGNGIVGRSNSYPLTLTDYLGHTLIYTDGSGNLYLHGNVYPMNFARLNGRTTVRSFSIAASTRPSLEDTGTARLVYGQAIVRLDPTFARAIDARRAYQVFLTPGGDTRGLYVAAKGPAAFVVREVQGGHGTFDFDYHIYAMQLGDGTTPKVLPPPILPVLHPEARTVEVQKW